jgi:hypothetical protein
MKMLDLLGKEHTIVPCTMNDIPVHFELVKDVIPSEEVIQYQQRMSECINAGSAYTLSDNSCFLYYNNVKPFCAHGVALYGKHAPLKLLALFAGIFTGIDTHTFKMEFTLHTGKFIDEYKSILTLTSLKRRNMPDRPLVIRIDELRNKISTLYIKRGIKWAA